MPVHRVADHMGYELLQFGLVHIGRVCGETLIKGKSGQT